MALLEVSSKSDSDDDFTDVYEEIKESLNVLSKDKAKILKLDNENKNLKKELHIA